MDGRRLALTTTTHQMCCSQQARASPTLARQSVVNDGFLTSCRFPPLVVPFSGEGTRGREGMRCRCNAGHSRAQHGRVLHGMPHHGRALHGRSLQGRACHCRAGQGMGLFPHAGRWVPAGFLSMTPLLSGYHLPHGRHRISRLVPSTGRSAASVISEATCRPPFRPLPPPGPTGSKLDHTVDVFAFGILMWVVRRLPY